MAKKCLLILVLAGVVAGGVFAQEAEEAGEVQEAGEAQEVPKAAQKAAQKASGFDFNSTAPQFFSFDIGAGVGYALDSNLPTQNIGGTVVGFKITVTDNLEVGIDVLSPLISEPGMWSIPPKFVGLRVGCRFAPVFGVAVGVGKAVVQWDTLSPFLSGGGGGGTAEPGISLGLFFDLFASRSARGIATGLRVRVDYVAETSDLGKGLLLFTPAFTIGL
jgi:hypothetical protein